MSSIHLGWCLESGKLRQEIKFMDFVRAWGYDSDGNLVEQATHHREWQNTCNRVTIDLTIQQADGISQRDFIEPDMTD